VKTENYPLERFVSAGRRSNRLPLAQVKIRKEEKKKRRKEEKKEGRDQSINVITALSKASVVALILVAKVARSVLQRSPGNATYISF